MCLQQSIDELDAKLERRDGKRKRSDSQSVDLSAEKCMAEHKKKQQQHRSQSSQGDDTSDDDDGDPSHSCYASSVSFPQPSPSPSQPQSLCGVASDEGGWCFKGSS